MPEEIVKYVMQYGYLAIFILIFLQETGMPNPFPNELLLMFSGYLVYKGILSIIILIITAVSADFTGTFILYFLFSRAGTYMLKKKPKWIPLSEKMILKLSERISGGGIFSIFLFRLTPFTRGYASVVAGLLGIKGKVFLPVALSSALLWSSFYIISGFIAGSSWESFSVRLDRYRWILLSIPCIIILTVALYKCIKYIRKKNTAMKVMP